MIIWVTMAIMSCFERLPNEHRRQIGKNEGLDKDYQEFYQINKDGECQRNRRETNSCERAHGTEYENQRNEANDHDVTGDHVRKKTYH